MNRQLICCSAASAICVAVVAGCGGGSSSVTDPDASGGATPKEMTKAYGDLVGICLASEFTGGPKFKEGQQMRRDLHAIIETAELAPDRRSEGLTAKDILFEVIPTLRECDESLALEAEVAVGK